MEIFHYVSNELKGTPNFECGNTVPIENTGAIYNDFDRNPGSLLEDMSTQESSYSQSSNLEEGNIADMQNLVPQSAIDYAILEADRTEGILYPYLAIDHDLVDCTSQPRDPAYLEKVYKIFTFAWKDILREMTTTTFEIYHMRERIDWSGADSVYDAWLL